MLQRALLNQIFLSILPFENEKAYIKIINSLNVKNVIIFETELWPVLLDTVSKYCLLFLFNAKISEKTFKIYKNTKFFFKDYISKFHHIVAKSEFDKNRFLQICEDASISYTKDLKSYFVKKNVNTKEHFDRIELPIKDGFFLAATTHHPEEEGLIKIFKKLKDKGF